GQRRPAVPSARPPGPWTQAGTTNRGPRRQSEPCNANASSTSIEVNARLEREGPGRGRGSSPFFQESLERAGATIALVRFRWHGGVKRFRDIRERARTLRRVRSGPPHAGADAGRRPGRAVAKGLSAPRD